MPLLCVVVADSKAAAAAEAPRQSAQLSRTQVSGEVPMWAQELRHASTALKGASEGKAADFT